MFEPTFIILAVLTIAAAILALEAKEVVYGAISLAFSFLGIAGFFILLDAPFVALFQITVYIGAIAVLIIFTVMLVRREKWMKLPEGRQKIVGLVGALLIALGFGYIVFESGLSGWMAPSEAASFTMIGGQLVGVYWTAFLILGIVLTASVLGALTLAKVEKETD